MPDDTTIRIHRLAGTPTKIVRAPVSRGWMDKAPDRFAYRCLPLNIANTHGWHVLNPAPFRVRWTGKPGTDQVTIEYTDPAIKPAISHFGMGIITFHINVLIRTPPGVSIYATGPVNQPKPGFTPLSGIVETDWLPFTFTMNWKITVTNHWLDFKQDEPFCNFFPVRLADIESYKIEVSDIADHPDLRAEVDAFSKSRTAFNTALKEPGSEARKQGWQKDYFQGRARPQGATHRTALHIADPEKP